MGPWPAGGTARWGAEEQDARATRSGTRARRARAMREPRMRGMGYSMRIRGEDERPLHVKRGSGFTAGGRRTAGGKPPTWVPPPPRRARPAAGRGRVAWVCRSIPTPVLRPASGRRSISTPVLRPASAPRSALLRVLGDLGVAPPERASGPRAGRQAPRLSNRPQGGSAREWAWRSERRNVSPTRGEELVGAGCPRTQRATARTRRTPLEGPGPLQGSRGFRGQGALRQQMRGGPVTTFHVKRPPRPHPPIPPTPAQSLRPTPDHVPRETPSPAALANPHASPAHPSAQRPPTFHVKGPPRPRSPIRRTSVSPSHGPAAFHVKRPPRPHPPIPPTPAQSLRPTPGHVPRETPTPCLAVPRRPPDAPWARPTPPGPDPCQPDPATTAVNSPAHHRERQSRRSLNRSRGST